MLSDPDKRKQYDAGGMFGFGGGGGPGGGFRFDPSSLRGGVGAFGDILSDLFGRGGGGSARPRGRDLETEVRLSFAQAVNGTEVSVTRARRGSVPDVPRQRRQAGHLAQDLPQLPGPRHRDAGPGDVLPLAALLMSAAAAARVIDEPVRDVRRARPHAIRCSATA